jgi:membrane-associated phospholipid phosphatase
MPSDARIRNAEQKAGWAARCEAADIALGLTLARAKDRPGVRALGILGEVGGWRALLALSAGTLVWGLAARDRRLADAGRRMLGAGVLASLTKMTAKRLVHRTRPNVLMDEGFYVKGWLGPNAGPWQSFPSGHSALSVAVARAVGRAYPEVRFPAYGGAAAVAFIQVLRGAHFPSDVIVGAAIGIAAEAAAEALAAAPTP